MLFSISDALLQSRQKASGLKASPTKIRAVAAGFLGGPRVAASLSTSPTKRLLWEAASAAMLYAPRCPFYRWREKVPQGDEGGTFAFSLWEAASAVMLFSIPTEKHRA